MQKFKTYQLAKQFYHKSNNLKLREPMRSQFQRASLSIVLNYFTQNKPIFGCFWVASLTIHTVSKMLATSKICLF